MGLCRFNSKKFGAKDLIPELSASKNQDEITQKGTKDKRGDAEAEFEIPVMVCEVVCFLGAEVGWQVGMVHGIMHGIVDDVQREGTGDGGVGERGREEGIGEAGHGVAQGGEEGRGHDEPERVHGEIMVHAME